MLSRGVGSECQCTLSPPDPCCLQLLSPCRSIQECRATAALTASCLSKVTFPTRLIHSKGRNREDGKHQFPNWFLQLSMWLGELILQEQSRMEGPTSKQPASPRDKMLCFHHVAFMRPVCKHLHPKSGVATLAAPAPLHCRVRQQLALHLAAGPRLERPGYVTAERESGCALFWTLHLEDSLAPFPLVFNLTDTAGPGNSEQTKVHLLFPASRVA